MPRVKEGNVMAEGTREKVLTHRSSKAPLLGRGELEGWATIGISLHTHMQALRGLSNSGTGYGWQEDTCSGYGRLVTSCAGCRRLGTSCVGWW